MRRRSQVEGGGDLRELGSGRGVEGEKGGGGETARKEEG